MMLAARALSHEMCVQCDVTNWERKLFSFIVLPCVLLYNGEREESAWYLGRNWVNLLFHFIALHFFSMLFISTFIACDTQSSHSKLDMGPADVNMTWNQSRNYANRTLFFFPDDFGSLPIQKPAKSALFSSRLFTFPMHCVAPGRRQLGWKRKSTSAILCCKRVFVASRRGVKNSSRVRFPPTLALLSAVRSYIYTKIKQKAKQQWLWTTSEMRAEQLKMLKCD